jgi:hypothetical protein
MSDGFAADPLRLANDPPTPVMAFDLSGKAT